MPCSDAKYYIIHLRRIYDPGVDAPDVTSTGTVRLRLPPLKTLALVPTQVPVAGHWHSPESSPLTRLLPTMRSQELRLLRLALRATLVAAIQKLGGSWAVGLWRNSWLAQVVAFK